MWSVIHSESNPSSSARRANRRTSAGWLALPSRDDERRQEDAELHARVRLSEQADVGQHAGQDGALVVVDAEQREADVRGVEHAEDARGTP